MALPELVNALRKGYKYLCVATGIFDAGIFVRDHKNINEKHPYLPGRFFREQIV
jgi:hypothetical protein